MFGRCRFDVELGGRNLEQRAKPRAHAVFVRRNLGLLGDNRQIDIDDKKANIANETEHLLEQKGGIDVCILHVRVGKPLPDVPRARRAKQRVNQRVDSDIAIAVRLKRVRKRNPHAANRQVVALCEAMHIESIADQCLAARRGQLEKREVLECREFVQIAAARDKLHRAAVRIDGAALIAKLACAQCVKQCRLATKLWRLNELQRLARQIAKEAAISRVMRAHERNDTIGKRRVQDRLENLFVNAAPRRIAHEHPFTIDLLQRIEQRFLARVAAANDLRFVYEALRIAHFLGRNGDNRLPKMVERMELPHHKTPQGQCANAQPLFFALDIGTRGKPPPLACC